MTDDYRRLTVLLLAWCVTVAGGALVAAIIIEIVY